MLSIQLDKFTRSRRGEALVAAAEARQLSGIEGEEGKVFLRQPLCCIVVWKGVLHAAVPVWFGLHQLIRALAACCTRLDRLHSLLDRIYIYPHSDSEDIAGGLSDTQTALEDLIAHDKAAAVAQIGKPTYATHCTRRAPSSPSIHFSDVLFFRAAPLSTFLYTRWCTQPSMRCSTFSCRPVSPNKLQPFLSVCPQVQY